MKVMQTIVAALGAQAAFLSGASAGRSMPHDRSLQASDGYSSGYTYPTNPNVPAATPWKKAWAPVPAPAPAPEAVNLVEDPSLLVPSTDVSDVPPVDPTLLDPAVTGDVPPVDPAQLPQLDPAQATGN